MPSRGTDVPQTPSRATSPRRVTAPGAPRTRRTRTYTFRPRVTQSSDGMVSVRTALTRPDWRSARANRVARRAATATATPAPRARRASRTEVGYYEGSSEAESDTDLTLGPDVQFVVLNNAVPADVQPANGDVFVPSHVVPPQDTDPTDEYGGTWLEDTHGTWRLVNNLSNEALLTMQMRLGDLERRPSPPPPAFVDDDVQHHHQQQQRGPRTLSMCRVCMGEEATVVFNNCGHMCVCVGCREKLARRSTTGNWLKCPLCRVSGGTMEVFV